MLLAACSGSGGSGSAPAGTPSSTASGPTIVGPTASGSASAGGASFAILPDSVLAAIPPLTYGRDANADQVMAANGAQPTVNAVFSGGISRSLLYNGQSVGGIELYRFGPSVTADGRAHYVPLMVESFAQVTPKPGTLRGTSVEVADGARGTAVSVIGWAKGEDVVLVWASGITETQKIAAEYLKLTG